MLTKVKELASEAFSRFRVGTRIPIRQDEALVCLRGQRGSCPKVEVAPRVAEVVVTFSVPGATAGNTTLAWDARFQTLSLDVAGTGEGERHRAVVAFASDVDGARGAAWLTEQTLTVRLPRHDRDTLTGLPAWLSQAVVPTPAPLCS